MFCENCGAKIDEDSKFCDNCGQAISEEVKLDDHKELQNQEALKPSKKRKSFGKIRGFIALGFILIVSIVIVVLFMQNDADNKPSTTTKEVIRSGEFPENMKGIDLTGNWYMLLSYSKKMNDGAPPYILYKLHLDVKRNNYGSHDVKVTTIESRYNELHLDYPGANFNPPELSGEGTITGYGNSLYFILNDKNHPYRHAIDFWEWEIIDKRYIKSMLFPQSDTLGFEEQYPFGYLQSEDTEDFYWK